jgi:hypothetical protein
VVTADAQESVRCPSTWESEEGVCRCVLWVGHVIEHECDHGAIWSLTIDEEAAADRARSLRGER